MPMDGEGCARSHTKMMDEQSRLRRISELNTTLSIFAAASLKSTSPSPLTSFPSSSAPPYLARLFTDCSITTNSPSLTFRTITLTVVTLLLSFLSFTTSLPLPPAQSNSLPPILGTWIKLTPQASNATNGIPIGRCDHTFTALGGQSLRANARVPFPNNQPPTSDPYADIIWLFGGHQNDEYKDSWFLDVSVSPPIWTQLTYSNPLSDVIARWGVPVSFLPNGLDAGDTGLTALLFSGYNNANIYVPEISSFNFASGTWRQVETLDPSDGSKPFPRGYTEWFPLPLGYGTGSINQSIDSGDQFLLGGLGAADGINYGAQDKDWSDQWIYNVTSTLWKRFGQLACTQNTTTCTDSESMDQFLAQMSIYFNSSATPVDMLAQLRPSEIYPQLNRILAGLNASAIGPSTLHDVPNACSTTCTQTETVPTYDPVTNATTSFTPAGIEGTRGVIVDGKLYEFGGYICADHGAQRNGGTDCFLGSMWVLDFATMEWTEIAPPDSDSIYAPFWPSKRAYNTMVAHPSKKLIFIQGGAFQDSSDVINYYNDLFAFDITISQFVPLKIGGVPPDIAWSAGAALHGNDIYLHGGCVGTTFYDSLYVLRLGLTVKADNCEASGTGLVEATAGEEASFIIQVKESSRVTNPTTNVTSLVFGANATYGVGLSFSAQVVTSDTGSVTLIPAQVVEVGDGLYIVRYLPTTGSNFQIFVYLDDVHIPGSPFAMKLHPQAIVAPSQCSASGYGTNMTVKGDEASVRVQMRDQFTNNFKDNTFALNGTVAFNFTATLLEIGSSTTKQPLSLTILNNQDGSFSLTYDVPSDISHYLLSISLNGQELADSPYVVVALDPIKLPNGLIIAFWLLTFVNIAFCLVSSGVVALYRHETVMRSSSPNFLHLLILGSILSSLSVIFLILDPTDSTCQAFHSCLSIGLVMSMSALLAKSHRVAQIFNAKQLKVQTNNSDSRLFVPTAIVILLMVLLNVLWIGINPIEAVWRPSSNPDEAAVLSYQTCSGENGNAWLGTTLAFCCGVLLYGVYLAVQTGHVPEQFNESKVIAGATYNIFICCIIIVPLLFFIGASSQFLVGRVVIESLVILWCSLFTVIALIGPKLLILFKLSSVRSLGQSPASRQVGAEFITDHRGSTVVKIEPAGGTSSQNGSSSSVTHLQNAVPQGRRPSASAIPTAVHVNGLFVQPKGISTKRNSFAQSTNVQTIGNSTFSPQPSREPSPQPTPRRATVAPISVAAATAAGATTNGSPKNEVVVVSPKPMIPTAFPRLLHPTSSTSTPPPQLRSTPVEAFTSLRDEATPISNPVIIFHGQTSPQSTSRTLSPRAAPIIQPQHIWSANIQQ